MIRYLPLVLSAVALSGAAVYNGMVTNRWSGGINSKALACAQYLELVPTEFGPWVSETNQDVDENIRETAGVVGDPVSRRYTNRETGQVVDLWLIVGHSNLIIRHTPDVCLVKSNFAPQLPNDTHHTIAVEGLPPAKTWTNIFFKDFGGQAIYQRVFWMWHCPRPGEDVRWEAPGHHVSDARYRFAGAKALFKMYFTAPAVGPSEDAEDSPAIAFANDFLPELDRLLARASDAKPPEATETASASDHLSDAKGSVQQPG
ncbi:MAG: hypothetical protein AAGJ46_01435 [Planctomycetota bacterium]